MPAARLGAHRHNLKASVPPFRPKPPKNFASSNKGNKQDKGENHAACPACCPYFLLKTFFYFLEEQRNKNLLVRDKHMDLLDFQLFRRCSAKWFSTSTGRNSGTATDSRWKKKALDSMVCVFAGRARRCAAPGSCKGRVGESGAVEGCKACLEAETAWIWP